MPEARREQWQQTVLSALRQQQLTQIDLAVRTGTPERTLRHLLSTENPPTADKVRRIAEVLGIDVLVLYTQLGWVDERSGEASAQPVSTGAHAGLVLLRDRWPFEAKDAIDWAVDRGWEVHAVVPRIGSLPVPGGGSERGLPLDTMVAVRQRGVTGASKHGFPNDDRRAFLAEEFAEILQRASGFIEDHKGWAAHLTSTYWPRAMAWLKFPRLLRTRPQRNELTLRVNDRPYNRVLLVGDHGAGLDEVGRFLADRSGWAYLHVSFATQQIFGRAMTEQIVFDRRCIEVAREALMSPTGGWHMHVVVAHSNPASADKLLETLEEDPERLIIYVRASSTLIDFADLHWSEAADHAVKEDALRRQVAVEERLKQLGPHTLIVETQLDAASLGEPFEVSRQRLADAHVETYRLIESCIGVPS